MQLTFAPARPEDASVVSAIRIAAAQELTARFGEGAWSNTATLDDVRNAIQGRLVLLVRAGESPVATFRLRSRRPWSIEAAPFTIVDRALYLVDMAVDPELQRMGIGRCCLDEAARLAGAWPAGAIRLDAYDGPAGAGDFYERCGYREVGRSVHRDTPRRFFERLPDRR